MKHFLACSLLLAACAVKDIGGGAGIDLIWANDLSFGLADFGEVFVCEDFIDPALELGWFGNNAKLAAAFVGGMGTAVVLVFNAGRDYQAIKSQLEQNSTEMERLRIELRALESDLFTHRLPQPDKELPR